MSARRELGPRRQALPGQIHAAVHGPPSLPDCRCQHGQGNLQVGWSLLALNRVPTAQGKQGKWPKRFPVRGKNREICQNTGKTQGILFAQVKNSLILQVKDTVIFAAKILFFSRSWIGLPSQFCVCNSHKLCKQGKHREFENTI